MLLMHHHSYSRHGDQRVMATLDGRSDISDGDAETAACLVPSRGSVTTGAKSVGFPRRRPVWSCDSAGRLCREVLSNTPTGDYLSYMTGLWAKGAVLLRGIMKKRRKKKDHIKSLGP